MNTVLALGIPLLLVGLIAMAVAFVTGRLISAFGIKRPRLFRTLFSLVIVASMFAMGSAASDHPAIGAIYWTGGVAAMVFMYLTVSFLLVKGLEFALRRPLPARVSAITASAASVVVVLWGVINAQSIRVQSSEIALAGLPAPVTVMFMSDVHIGNHRGRKFLQRIVDETNRAAPDFVAMSGDLVDARSALAPGILAPLAEMEAPVFYVGGNHEKDVDQAAIEAAIAKLGVHVLRNEIVEAHGVQIVGLRYMRADDKAIDLHPSNERETIRSTLPTLAIKAGTPTILLHHSPIGLSYLQEKGIDLMLAGHTHAGQVFPATWLAALLFPVNRGLQAFGTLQVFVSQGAGTFLVPLRVGTASELNLIRLIPK